MFVSSKQSDVILLLDDKQPADLSKPYQPSQAYLDAYYQFLSDAAPGLAAAIERLGHVVYREHNFRNTLTLISVLDTGILTGILLKRSLAVYTNNIVHYSIPIHPTTGIDPHTLDYILQRHRPEDIQFVDGWTGDGTVQRALNHALVDFPLVSPGLAVLCDPVGVAAFSAYTHDLPMPAAFLEPRGSLASLLLDFVAVHFQSRTSQTAEEEVAHVSECFHNMTIRAGINETVSALLHDRVFVVLVNGEFSGSAASCLLQLAQARNVPILRCPLQHFCAVAVERAEKSCV